MALAIITTVLPLVSSTIQTGLQIRSFIQQVKENEVDSEKLMTDLKAMEKKLRDQEEEMKHGESWRETFKKVMEEIKSDFSEVDRSMMDILETARVKASKKNPLRIQHLKKYFESAEYSKEIKKALELVLDCQRRLETHNLIKATIVEIKAGFKSLDKRMPEDFNEFDNGLHRRFDQILDLIQVGKLQQTNIPNDVTERLIRIEGALLQKQENSRMTDLTATFDPDKTESDDIEWFGDVIDNISSLSKCEIKSEEAASLMKSISTVWNNSWRIYLGEDSATLNYDKYSSGSNKSIGSGSTGKVYSGTFQQHSDSDKLLVAIKEVSVEKLDTNIRKKCAEVLRQAFIHKQLEHTCIVRLYGLVWPPELAINGEDLINANGNDSEFDEDDESDYQISFVMQRMKTNLEAGRRKIRDEIDFVKVLFDVSNAVSFLHSKNIVHRDIKAQNVLIDLDRSNKLRGNAKLCDFGISKRRHDEKYNPVALTEMTQTGGKKGTPMYRPPETFSPGHVFTKPSWDVWSFGILLCVIFGQPSEKPKFDISALPEEPKIDNWINSIEKIELRTLAIECLRWEETERIPMLGVFNRMKEIHSKMKK